MQLKGFVFDFDGLIVDTEMPQFVVFQEEFAKLGATFTYKDWWKIIGTGYDAYNPFDALARVAGDHRDAAYFRKRIDRRVDDLLNQTQPLPGVVEFIREAHSLGIPMAVASSSPRAWVRGHLERIGLLDAFDIVITSADVQQVKPDPELYQLAVRSLKLQPEECVAFEDSLNGIKSAKGAGLTCIAIPNEITREMPLAMADWIVESFIGLKVQGVLKLTVNTKTV